MHWPEFFAVTRGKAYRLEAGGSVGGELSISSRLFGDERGYADHHPEWYTF